MFCPKCHGEYREGFTRCASCDVDLVTELPAAEHENQRTAAPPPMLGFVSFCGFVTLEDARDARDILMKNGTLSRVLIRENPEGSLDTPIQEEYWLQVQPRDLQATAAILGYDAVEDDANAGGTFRCSGCGNDVAAAEAFCSNCGARFEDGP